MDLKTVAEGDLLAYLDGADRAPLAKTIETTPELQRKLEELRQVEQMLQESYKISATQLEQQDLVDVVTGQAYSNSKT